MSLDWYIMDLTDFLLSLWYFDWNLMDSSLAF